MKILINEENKSKIEDYIKSIRGKETSRLMDATKILTVTARLTKESNQLLKKHLKNLCYEYVFHECMPQYRFECDAFKMEYTAQGWALTSFYRKTCLPDSKDPSCFYWDIKDAEKLKERKKEVADLLLSKFLQKK